MGVYIVLFRGVGGATQLPTARLRTVLTEAGFANVATYINSGNAVVKSRLGREKVVKQVADICRAEFKFEKDVYAPTLKEWGDLIARNPFPKSVTPGNLLHAAVLATAPSKDAVTASEKLATGGDRFSVVGKVAYLATPNGFSKSKLAEGFDKLIGVPNTARNWNTVLKLQALGEAAS